MTVWYFWVVAIDTGELQIKNEFSEILETGDKSHLQEASIDCPMSLSHLTHTETFRRVRLLHGLSWDLTVSISLFLLFLNPPILIPTSPSIILFLTPKPLSFKGQSLGLCLSGHLNCNMITISVEKMVCVDFLILIWEIFCQS